MHCSSLECVPLTRAELSADATCTRMLWQSLPDKVKEPDRWYVHWAASSRGLPAVQLLVRESLSA